MGNNLTIEESLSEEVLLRPIHKCLTPKMTEVFEGLSEELKSRSLTSLEEELSITPILRQIKISFWDQYRRTLAQGIKQIEIQAVVSDICTREYFYQYIIHKPPMFVWLFHPPVSFDHAAVEALDYGIERVREMLTAPLFMDSPDGEAKMFIKDNAAIVLNAVKFLDARVKGSPLQRIEQKSLHLHKSVDAPKGISREELDTELENLRQRLDGGQMVALPPPPEDVE